MKVVRARRLRVPYFFSASEILERRINASPGWPTARSTQLVQGVSGSSYCSCSLPVHMIFRVEARWSERPPTSGLRLECVANHLVIGGAAMQDCEVGVL